MIYDGVVLFAKALHELDRSQDVNIRPLSCDSADTSTFGNSLANYMRLVSLVLKHLEVIIKNSLFVAKL